MARRQSRIITNSSPNLNYRVNRRTRFEIIEIDHEQTEAQQTYNWFRIDKWKKADQISFLGLLVNLALAFATFMLYQLASNDSKSARDSANAAVESVKLAKQTVEETKQYNDSSLKVQEKAYEKTVKDAREQSKLDSQNSTRQEQSLIAQIASLKETQKQFQIGNEPYLQYMIYPRYDDNSKNLIIVPAILNYGKYPVIVTNYNVLKSFAEMTDDQFAKGASNFPEQNLVAIDHPMVISVDTMREPHYSYSKNHPLYIRGEIIYKELINKTIKKYTFKLRMDVPDAVYYYYRKDEIVK